MRVLCVAGADKDKSMAHGVTPLSLAVFNGQLAVVRYLSDVGADTDKPQSDGLTPLHAARWTSPTLVQVRASCFTNSSE